MAGMIQSSFSMSSVPFVEDCGCLIGLTLLPLFLVGLPFCPSLLPAQQTVVPWAVSGKTLAKHSLNDKSKITPTYTRTHVCMTLINQANKQTVSHTYIYVNRHSQLVKHCACFVFAFLLSPVPLEPICCHQFCFILFPFKWLVAAIKKKKKTVTAIFSL